MHCNITGFIYILITFYPLSSVIVRTEAIMHLRHKRIQRVQRLPPSIFFRLINKLLKADGQQPVTFQKKVMSPFVAMTNIENFNKGALQYGLEKEGTFQSGDLWEVRKGPFLNVINTLHSLGFVVSITFLSNRNS